ncbi:MAG: zinc metallopeptidase [Gemmataceae bacterium]
MFFFDPMYLLFLLPGMALAAWAQWRVKSAFNWASGIRPQSGYRGVAAAILHAEHIDNVRIEPSTGFLSDHYDPAEKVLRLSPDVGEGVSLAAVGVAAHEAGHAIQDARGYRLLVMRNTLVPLANFGSSASWLIIMAGFLLAYLQMFEVGRLLVYVGIAAFSLTVFFQLVNLPVEFDASRRARVALQDTGLVTPEEDAAVAKVLNAAALTYVAATLTAILTLLYFLFRAGLLGGRSRG